MKGYEENTQKTLTIDEHLFDWLETDAKMASIKEEDICAEKEIVYL